MRRLLSSISLCIVLLALGATSAQAAPTARYSLTPTDPYTGERVTFDGSTSSCDAVPCTYRWTDDGPDGPGGTTWLLGSGQVLRFTFSNAGTKWVRLRVRNARGSASSVMRAITVKRGPRPQPTPNPTPTPSPTPSPTPTPTPSPTPSPTPTPTPTPSPSPTPTPSPSPTPTPTPQPGVLEQFPNPSTTGTPAGWVPTVTRSTDLTVSQAGALVRGYRFTNGASLIINASNVTVDQSEFQGGSIDSGNGTLIQDVTINRLAPESNGSEGVIGYCGYTARRVEIANRSEGFRVGCEADATIEDSYVRIDPPANCGDWHGDGVQGYTGSSSVHNDLTITNTTIDFNETTPSGGFCGGTSPFFYVGGPGGSPGGHAYVNGLLLKGGGYSFRMGVPGSVQRLRVVNGSWRSAPTDITDTGCAPISPWEAKTVTVDGNWGVTSYVRDIPC